MKLVINSDYGGFSVPDQVLKLMSARGHGLAALALRDGSDFRNVARNDPYLVQAVEDLGEEVAPLEVVEVDPNSTWYLHEYDGMEWVCYFNPNERGCALM